MWPTNRSGYETVRRDTVKFESLGLVVRGERGEYHTLVVDSPQMGSRLKLREIGRLMHDVHRMLDLELM